MKEIKCEACNGTGYEICTNPDHGFIDVVRGETRRLGCPCCGHDEQHRIFTSKCEMCGGVGKLYTESDLKAAREEGAAEMRDRCLESVKAEHLQRPTDCLIDDTYDEAVCHCEEAIILLGPLSSLESRVRRETVEKIRKGLWIDDVETVSTMHINNILNAIIEGEE